MTKIRIMQLENNKFRVIIDQQAKDIDKSNQNIETLMIDKRSMADKMDDLGSKLKTLEVRLFVHKFMFLDVLSF